MTTFVQEEVAAPQKARKETHGVEHDLTQEQAHPVRSRFELAIRRMMDAWFAAGHVRVSLADVKLAREFLEQDGCKVEDAPGANVRVVSREGRTQEMSREAAVVAALRRLAKTE
jgi:hypothetical protein